MTVEDLNGLPREAAARALRACCGSSRWVAAMVAARPYRSLEHLLAQAEIAWRETGPGDWDEAFSHHPRIGEREARAALTPTAAGWSAREQSGAAAADAATLRAIADGNREYERRFGRIYLVCAQGRRAEEILTDLRGRLANDPEQELGVARAEQGKITALRLRELLREPGAVG
jgi:2-oxo-4-hydroxy-4-carboxy-5-ureidoimidazoline decarboxylase